MLQDVDFKIQKGEMLSIVGKNGAGKSTLSNLSVDFLLRQKALYFCMVKI